MSFFKGIGNSVVTACDQNLGNGEIQKQQEHTKIIALLVATIALVAFVAASVTTVTSFLKGRLGVGIGMSCCAAVALDILIFAIRLKSLAKESRLFVGKDASIAICRDAAKYSPVTRSTIWTCDQFSGDSDD